MEFLDKYLLKIEMHYLHNPFLIQKTYCGNWSNWSRTFKALKNIQYVCLQKFPMLTPLFLNSVCSWSCLLSNNSKHHDPDMKKQLF